MKINAKYKPIVFSLLMALGMSFFMSLVMVIVKVGITPQFIQILLSEWLLGFVISILPSFFLPKIINKLFKY